MKYNCAALTTTSAAQAMRQRRSERRKSVASCARRYMFTVIWHHRAFSCSKVSQEGNTNDHKDHDAAAGHAHDVSA
jgi:hypothetical protein